MTITLGCYRGRRGDSGSSSPGGNNLLLLLTIPIPIPQTLSLNRVCIRPARPRQNITLPRRRKHEINTALISLLRISPQPPPLQNTIPGRTTSVHNLLSRISGRERNSKSGIIGRKLGEFLVGVRVEEQQDAADNGVRGCLDDGHVGGSLVRDRERYLDDDDLA